MRLSVLRKMLWGLVTAAVVGFSGLVFWQAWQPPGRTMVDAETVRPSDIRTAFALTDHEGEAATEADYRGKWLLIFFGFTNCPDVCPTTLSVIAGVMDGLDRSAENIQPLFITIDPRRDRVQDLAEYVAAFHPSIIGFTGTEAEIATTAENFRIYYETIEQEGAPDGYTMAHTSAIYLISPNGYFLRAYAYGTRAEDIIRDLKPLTMSAR